MIDLDIPIEQDFHPIFNEHPNKCVEPNQPDIGPWDWCDEPTKAD